MAVPQNFIVRPWRCFEGDAKLLWLDQPRCSYHVYNFSIQLTNCGFPKIMASHQIILNLYVTFFSNSITWRNPWNTFVGPLLIITVFRAHSTLVSWSLGIMHVCSAVEPRREMTTSECLVKTSLGRYVRNHRLLPIWTADRDSRALYTDRITNVYKLLGLVGHMRSNIMLRNRI